MSEQQKFLIFGRTGWLGGLLGDILTEQCKDWVYADSRLENLPDVISELNVVKPTHVLNAAGLTGRPNVDWCESNKEDVVKVNICGTLNLATACRKVGCHLTVYATGCIYSYDDDHAMGSGKGFTEDDVPNFTGSFYSQTKAACEELLKVFQNVCILRVRMPLSSDLEHPRNFIKKISLYERVVNIPNSMTVLEEMLPYSIELANRKRTGIYNFTNPGVVSHNEILEMYREYYRSDFQWENFSLEEQSKILAAPRSNNELDVSKLKAEFPGMLDIKSSLLKYVFEPQRSFKNGPRRSLPERNHAIQYAPSTIMVTGCAGFIGSHLAKRLVANYPNYHIIGVDKVDYCASIKNMDDFIRFRNFTFVEGDLASESLMKFIFKSYKIDTVIHLAAQSHVDNSFANATQFTRDNVYATHVLLQTSNDNGVKRFIQVSTDEVYGCSQLGGVDRFNESSILNPTNPYSASKAACEMYCHSYMHSYKMPIIITRGNNVYGPHQYPEKMVPNFMLKFVNGQALKIQGTGQQVRSMIFVEDVAAAFDRILHYGYDYQVYNIGAPVEKSVLEIASDIGQLFGSEPRFEFTEDRPFNDQRYDLSCAKLQSLGWKCEVDWEEGLKRTKDWYSTKENVARWTSIRSKDQPAFGNM